MEQIQQPVTIGHLVQVYNTTDSKQNPQIIHVHPSLQTQKVYQQALTESIPTRDIQISQNQIVVSQGLQSLQSLQSLAPLQSLQSSDMSQSLIASHVILPQHMLVNSVSSYYSQYEFPKEPCVVTKEEIQPIENQEETDITCQTEPVSTNKKSRNHIPDPKNWACNVRKLKHQRGEAYISRRGKHVPEREIRNTKDCHQSCRYKCNDKISDDDRKHIFKAFYTLSTNEKRYFILSTTERLSIKHSQQRDKGRNYTYKYFFTVKSERFSVCKDFYLGTLAISQKPVYNVHKGKSDFNMPKPDGRGLACSSTHSLPPEVKETVRKHIKRFLTIDSKPIIHFSKKRQYLSPSLSVKKMHEMYMGECCEDEVVPVKESMYRKIFKEEFNLHFKLRGDEQLCGRCKGSIKKK